MGRGLRARSALGSRQVRVRSARGGACTMCGWIGNIYLDSFSRDSPAFLNSTGLMYPSFEWSLKLLYQWT